MKHDNEKCNQFVEDMEDAGYEMDVRDADGISDREYDEAAKDWIYYGRDPERDVEMER